MKHLDRVLAVALITLGCVHNFVAAPMSFDELSSRAPWFIAGGLSLWYAGFINLLRTRPPGRDDRLLGWLCVLTNVSLLLFVLVFASLAGKWAEPQAIGLIAAVAVLTVTSVWQLVGLRKGTANPRSGG